MKQRQQITAKEALVRTEEMCARAEHASGEIREKLRRWGIGTSDSDKIIQSLTARRFIDDRRFAAAFTRDKIEYSGWGRRKIALAMYQKHIDRDIINEALASVDMEHYMKRLTEIIGRRASQMPDADTYKGRTRLFRFAATRGFEPDLIARAIKDMKDE